MRVVAFLVWILAFAAQPLAAATSPRLQPVQQQLSALVASRSPDVGVAALDLDTGEIVSVNGHTPFPLASTMKVAVAAAYLAQVDYGRRSLNDTIAGRSAASLMEAMMIRSDNHATDILLRDLGGPDAIEQWVQFVGVRGMRIDRTIAQLLRAKRDLWDVQDSGSPIAMVELLRKIDRGNVLKPASRAYLMDLMSRCKTGKNRMPALLPGWVRVEHKTGTLSGYASDVGYLTLPNGKRIALAVFTRGGSDRPRTIAETARAIYDGFANSLRNYRLSTLSVPATQQ